MVDLEEVSILDDHVVDYCFLMVPPNSENRYYGLGSHGDCDILESLIELLCYSY
jgi:hypothetical protein